MSISADMHGTSCGADHRVAHYLTATAELAKFLGKCFAASFPDHFARYEKAFKAGVWRQEDPGPWLGRALVWKLQVSTHMDGLDGGPTAIFNFGSYQGGELYIPDLRLKLRLALFPVMLMVADALFLDIVRAIW